MILDTVDKKRLISKRLYRDSCAYNELQKANIKDLRKLGDLDLTSTVIVDDKPENF